MTWKTEERNRRRGGQASALILIGLLAACGNPAPTSTPPATANAGPTSVAHAPEIRFGLIGEVTQTNVWGLFDSSGYSYNNYAVRSGYWPRLYGLSLPDYKFEAIAASGPPSAIHQEGGLYAATVVLKPDLKWSDGTPFTAEDVAFTANTAVAFQLGFDWANYYSAAWLDHAEAVDSHTVKYYFNQAPNVGVWQYGVLQGPIVQDQFWATQVAGASALLPPSDLVAQIGTLKARVADLEQQVGILNYSAVTSQGEGARVIQSGLKRQIGDLDKALNDLAKAQGSFDEAMNAARSALYSLDDQNEPHLGASTPVAGSGADSGYQNKMEASYPVQTPNFDRAVYKSFVTLAAAEAALQAGQVDVVLDPTSPGPLTTLSLETPGLMKSPTRSMRFLVMNTQAGALSSQSLRQALACLIDQDQLAGALGGSGIALNSFIAPQETEWYEPSASLPCHGLDASSRLTQAVQALKAAGFTWTAEPSAQAAGVGLKGPDGKDLPTIALLVPQSDAVRGAAGEYILAEASRLGIEASAQPVSDDRLDFQVFSSHRYDMALLGWRTSLYPGYLCDWFGAGRPFQYSGSDVIAECRQLDATSNLETAEQAVGAIQKGLSQDVPFVPLYSQTSYDVRDKVNYPFNEVLGGLAGVYGAPNLAIPQSP